MKKGLFESNRIPSILLPLSFLIVSFLLVTAFAGEAPRDYRDAFLQFEDLLKDPQKRKERHHWITCVNGFQAALTKDPGGPWADDALFMMGHVYAELYGMSSSPYDRQEAVDYFNRLLKRFSASPHRLEAEKAIDELISDAREEKERGEGAKRKHVSGKKEVESKRLLKTSELSKHKAGAGVPSESLAQVSAVRFWSSPTYARVVIDVDSEVTYHHQLLKGEEPGRVLIDLAGARMGPGIKPFVPGEGALLADARLAPYGPDGVRVILDARTVDHIKVFSLPNPFRILVDVRGVPVKTASKKRVKNGEEESASALPKGALAKQFALGVKRIVIDPGHGGDDFGATGHLKGVYEKNVTLEISHRLAGKIRERLDFEAVLTREDDRFLSLEERTAFANTAGADLFISIHTNAHKKMASYGTETYFLNLATDEEAVLLAARENATSAHSMSDLKGILTDLMTQAKQGESSRLAGHVQNALVQTQEAQYGKVKDKGVKQAPFYVLLGAHMPCILIEVAFITNPRECLRLNSAGFQEAIAEAIVSGIETYVKELRQSGTSET
jgi:N-acetylmuramoyl-L-alanine amidase